ncbi:MAG: hypothetical protein EBY04_06925, partial [Actinobacteria bacterium]|nr:hypothetical protein [Actinomycetota bacterium]
MSLRARVLRHELTPEPQPPHIETIDEMWSRLQPLFASLTAEVRAYLSSLPDRSSMSDDWLRTQAESELIRLFKSPRFEMPLADGARPQDAEGLVETRLGERLAPGAGGAQRLGVGERDLRGRERAVGL